VLVHRGRSKRSVAVAGQSWERVFDPLDRLCQADGVVVLADVGLTRMTLLHYAEQCAGRQPFRRWARRRDSTIRVVAVGGCSEGFERLGPALASIERLAEVGTSRWRIFPAREAVELAAAAIRADASITTCATPNAPDVETRRLVAPTSVPTGRSRNARIIPNSSDF
jgi:aminoglycoside N3'-acetyltransferase